MNEFNQIIVGWPQCLPKQSMPWHLVDKLITRRRSVASSRPHQQHQYHQGHRHLHHNLHHFHLVIIMTFQGSGQAWDCGSVESHDHHHHDCHYHHPHPHHHYHFSARRTNTIWQLLGINVIIISTIFVAVITIKLPPLSEAGKHEMVVGSQARILYSDQRGRTALALRLTISMITLIISIVK